MSAGIEIGRRGSTYRIVPGSRLLRFIDGVVIPPGGSGQIVDSAIMPGKTYCLWDLAGGSLATLGDKGATIHEGYVAYFNDREETERLRVYVFR